MLEIPELRTAASKTFKLDNGLYRTEAGCHSHVQKSGLFVPVSSLLDVERGTDPDTGRSYEVSNHSTQHPFYFKFAPDCLKIKHVENGQMAVFRPRDINLGLSYRVEKDTVVVDQLWKGIDAKFTVFDKGLKADYTITSSEGQRVVEFDTALEGKQGFRLHRAFYSLPSNRPVYIPQTLTDGLLSMDFRNLPIGSVVDPTTTIQPDATAGVDAEIVDDTSSATNFGTSATLTLGDALGAGSQNHRFCCRTDLSTISGTITDAVFSLYLFFTGNVPNGTALFLKQLNRNWVEGEVTWLSYSTGNLWAVAGGLGAADTIAARGNIATYTSSGAESAGFVDWTGNGDVVPFATVIQDWIDTPSSNFGVIGYASALENQNPFREIDFRSSDYVTASDRPKWTITHTGTTPPTTLSGASVGKTMPFKQGPRFGFGWRR